MYEQRTMFALLFISIYGLSMAFGQSPDDYSIKWFTQKVDHTSYANSDTFQQRYIIQDKHWKKNGPIFLYTGNEGNILAFVNNTGILWENAYKFGAMIIFVEHRFYGESLPYGKDSFNDLTRLGFLTVEQSLADFAEFLMQFKANIYPQANGSPVIAFGGSYGGMLAAWFRMKYPHLCVGSLASSAPILQLPGIYKCGQFEQIATRDYNNYSPNCPESIRNSWKSMRNLAKSADGLEWLTETFKLCEPLKNVNDLISFIKYAWDYLAMSDYSSPSKMLVPLPKYPIHTACSYLSNPKADDKTLLTAIQEASNVFFNYTGSVKCNDIHIKDKILDFKAWQFQACTEIIYPFCSDGKNDMYEPHQWNLTKYSQYCKKRFGVPSDSTKVLQLFGGTDLKNVENIIFSNGLRDPWSAGGVIDTKDVNDKIVVLPISGACHHEDLQWSNPNDSVNLTETRKIELMQILQWLKNYYDNEKITYVFPDPNF